MNIYTHCSIVYRSIMLNSNFGEDGSTPSRATQLIENEILTQFSFIFLILDIYSLFEYLFTLLKKRGIYFSSPPLIILT